MLTRGVFGLMAVLVLAVAIACGDDDEGAPSEVKVTEADDGASVELAEGGKLIVSLTSNPSTGFRWFVADPAPAQLRVEGEAEYLPPVSATPLVGAPGTEVFTFTAVETGMAELKLVYQRSFEAGPPEQTFSLTVEVK